MAAPDMNEVADQRDIALLSANEGTTRFPGMTYEEGVAAALTWVLGEEDIKPLEAD